MAVNIVHTLGRGGGVSRASEGAFLRLKDASVMFAYCRFTDETGHDDGDCDLYFILSRDEGKSWSRMRKLIGADIFGVKNIMSVSLMRMQNGDLGVFFLIKENDGASTVMLARSKDEGESFYSFTPCTLPERRAYVVINNDRVERLKSGLLVVPLAHHRGSFGENGRSWTDWRAICEFLLSDDDGLTWHMARDAVYPPFQDTNSGLQEPGVIEFGENKLFMYARTDKFCQYGAYSFDGGEHWTGAFPTRFSSPCSPLKIAQNPYTGDFYAVWNPIPNYAGRRIWDRGGGRTPLVYAVSRDRGVSWTEPSVIEGDLERGYCYPALFFTKDGALLVSYCAGGREDVHCLARTNIAKIDLD